MSSHPALKNKRLDESAYVADRETVVQSWPTGGDVDFDRAVARQVALPESMRVKRRANGTPYRR